MRKLEMNKMRKRETDEKKRSRFPLFYCDERMKNYDEKYNIYERVSNRNR